MVIDFITNPVLVPDAIADMRPLRGASAAAIRCESSHERTDQEGRYEVS